MSVWGVRVRGDASGPGEVVFELEGTRLYDGKEVLLAKLMMVSHEWRQERARRHLRENM